MPELISLTDSHGNHRACAETCYDATDHECRCICKGRNHGVGFKQAVNNAARLFLFPDQLDHIKFDQAFPRSVKAHPMVHKHLNTNFYPKPPPK